MLVRGNNFSFVSNVDEIHSLIMLTVIKLEWMYMIAHKFCDHYHNYVSCIMPSVLWRCWLGGKKDIRPAKKTEWWGAGMVICLERGADLHMAQVMPLPLTVPCFSICRLALPFWYRLTWVVSDKRLLNGCVCVCVFVCVCVCVCVCVWVGVCVWVCV